MTKCFSPENTAEAAALLRAGELVAFGTETVYGLGADACNAQAVAAIYTAKGRPSFNPLICHFADADKAFQYVIPNLRAEKLAARFWPGPLTMVLPRAENCRVSLLAGAGLPTLAVRLPGHDTALKLLKEFGGPVAAPSANRSGRISPTSAGHVLSELGGRIAAVLDSGPCVVGLESTVLDLSGPEPVLLRPGGVSLEALQAEIGLVQRVTEGQALASPGMLRSHYAPTVPVRLNVAGVGPDEALLAFGDPLPGAGLVLQLSESRNLAEAAENIYRFLYIQDAECLRLGLKGIAVMPIPIHGLGLAINDRLTRAAAPRK